MGFSGSSESHDATKAILALGVGRLAGWWDVFCRIGLLDIALLCVAGSGMGYRHSSFSREDALFGVQEVSGIFLENGRTTSLFALWSRSVSGSSHGTAVAS